MRTRPTLDALSFFSLQVKILSYFIVCFFVASDHLILLLACAFFGRLLCAVLDGLGEVPGCFGASRLVCKSEWDYKLIVKFEDAPSLTDFMKNEYTPLWVEQFKPQAEQLAVDGKIHEQNFVFDDIDE